MSEVTYAETAVAMDTPYALSESLKQARCVSVAMDENAVPVMSTSYPRIVSVAARDLPHPGGIPVAVVAD